MWRFTSVRFVQKGFGVGRSLKAKTMRRTLKQLLCLMCSAHMLQWCSQNRIRPSEIVVYDGRGGFYLMRCKKCGKEWKTKAKYVELCEFVKA